MAAAPFAEGQDRQDSTAPRKIRIGQIGTAHGHANKIAVYRASPDYDVVGIVEPDATRQRSAKDRAEYRDLPWITREELLADPTVEAVLVETDIPDLLPTAEACIAAGKSIHLDKPAGASLPQFRRLLAEAERRGLLVQMGYMYRYNPAFLLLQDLLARGWLGEIFEVHAVMSKVVPPAERLQLARFGGGMMFELGGHLIDLIVTLLGKPDGITSVLQHVSPQADGLADSTISLWTYPRATATIRTAGVEVSGGERRHLTVCGTRGTFHMQPLDAPKVRVAFDASHDDYRAGYQDVPVPKYARYVGDAADMAVILRGTARSRYSYAHDLLVQECVLRSSQMSLD